MKHEEIFVRKEKKKEKKINGMTVLDNVSFDFITAVAELYMWCNITVWHVCVLKDI